MKSLLNFFFIVSPSNTLVVVMAQISHNSAVLVAVRERLRTSSLDPLPPPRFDPLLALDAALVLRTSDARDESSVERCLPPVGLLLSLEML
jgi:hypothetical protein